ncbi:MAG: mycothiol system anti-sigma-R factor [Candidatus Nanopelagicales bacterium]|nr:mycothiol system anti-sigma-R factor [Candidatus Nanopelagicales bacterium]
MSCGNPHATPCTEVLSLTYLYLDNEIDEVHYLEVTTHLTECPPCRDSYATEVSIKAMVKRSCSGTQITDDRRARIVAELRQISITYLD